MYTIKRKVAISDIGADSIAKPVSLLEMIGDCEQFQIDETPYITDYFGGRNIGIFVTSRQIDFEKPVSYGEQVSVTTSVFTNNRISGQRNTFIYNADGEPVVRSFVMGAFVDLATQAITKIDQDYVDNYPYDEKLDMQYLPRKIKVPVAETAAVTTAAPVKVSAHYIDYYNHMNNVNYVLVALAAIGKVGCPQRIRVEYKIPAVLGDMLVPTIYTVGDVTTVVLSSDRGVSCVVEIS